MDYDVNPVLKTTKVVLLTAPFKPVTINLNMVFFLKKISKKKSKLNNIIFYA